MIFISHRGNLEGRNPSLENQPEYVERALNDGYVVEIDVYDYLYAEDVFMLGHDDGKWRANGWWIRKHQSLLCHAKCVTVLMALKGMNVHCFMHDKDPYVLTSKGWVISHVNNKIAAKGTVQMMPEVHQDLPEYHYDGCFGVCSDYIKTFKHRILHSA